MLESIASFKQPEIPGELDLHDKLGLYRGAETAEVDGAWSNLSPEHQADTATHLAWKLLRDPAYRALYEQTGSLHEVYEAGFIVDRVKIDQVHLLTPKPHELTTPYNKLEQVDAQEDSRRPVVLLTTGGFSPIHYGHLSMMETAKTTLEQRGRSVIGGYISPSHDDYVGQKYGGEAKLSASHRIYLAQEAVDSSDWLMVDPWESEYAPGELNFTDVIRRLQLYLENFAGRQVDVVYVSGADNAGFATVLQYTGGGVCVSRGAQFNEVPAVYRRPEIASNPDLLFVPSDSPVSEFSSTKVRNWKPLLMPKDASATYFHWRMQQLSEDHDVVPPARHYIVRDDGEWSMQQYYPDGLSDTVRSSLGFFKRGLEAVIENSFQKVEMPDVSQELGVHFLPLEEQRLLAEKLTASRPTLNLDTITNNGPGGINFSRLFGLCDGQSRPYDLVERPGFPSLEEQIGKIAAGDYLFLDDDIATGSTLNHLMGLLPDDVRVTSIRALFNESRRLHNEFNMREVTDVVDLRDFILGAYAGGLVVTAPDGHSIARAPYMLPFVSPYTRASTPLSSVKEFSRACWQLNVDFFSSLDEELVLDQATSESKKLMTQLGFSLDTKLADIATKYVRLLAPGSIKPSTSV